jgi:hypothetical protein
MANKTKSQGAEAAFQGDSLKDDVAALLATNNRYIQIETAQYNASTGKTPAEKLRAAAGAEIWKPKSVFVRDVAIGYDVYGDCLKAHLVFQAEDWPEPLGMFCVHQMVPGSAIRKLPFLTMSLRERSQTVKCCILLDGKGITEEAKRFVRDEASRSCGRIIWVIDSIGEFRSFLTSGSRYPAPTLLH